MGGPTGPQTLFSAADLTDPIDRGNGLDSPGELRIRMLLRDIRVSEFGPS